MILAKILDDGQVRIPELILAKLNLKNGDKIVFEEIDGQIVLENSSMRALKKVQSAFAGAAEEAGFKNEQEMQEYMLQIRKEVRGY